MIEALKDWSLFGRVALGIVVGFLLLHAGSLMFYNHEKMVAEAGQFAAGTAERAITVAAAAAGQPGLLELLSTPSFKLSYAAEALETPGRIWPHSDEIAALLNSRLTSLGFPNPAEVRFWYTINPRTRQLVLQLPMAERWLVVQAAGPDPRGHTVVAAIWTTALSLTILVGVLWATRRFTRVLPRVVEVAERLGRDAYLSANLPTLTETGPKEIRRLVRVFNDMQSRVSRLLDERNTMLGALSHDVRTLVTRLSLRLENLDDEKLRDQSRADVAAITASLDEVLAYTRDEAGEEPRVPVDLPSLLQSLLDDEVDRGVVNEDQLSYSGPLSLVVEAGPAGLKRVFGNLIDNALRYGGAATVVLDALSDGSVQVDVVDPGPGIPKSDQQRALEPFVRLEPSRSRDTGGSGLGLSIARRLTERHGGVLSFPDTETGFSVRVVLPAFRSGPHIAGTRNSG